MARRAPLPLGQRIATIFAAPSNVARLRREFARLPEGPQKDFILTTLSDAVLEFAHGEALDILLADPLAGRVDGYAAPAHGLGAEVERLNRAFVSRRLASARMVGGYLEKRGGDGVLDDDEDYAYRMFVSDSLRPPGFEGLNGPGPLYEYRELQAASVATPEERTRRHEAAADRLTRAGRECVPDRSRRGSAREGLVGGREGLAEGLVGGREGLAEGLVGGRESANPQWSDGDLAGRRPSVPLRPRPAQWAPDDGAPERAVAARWRGDRLTPAEVAEMRGEEVLGELSDSWPAYGGRSMRRSGPPLWQQYGHRWHETDLAPDLGRYEHEMGGMISRMDMTRARTGPMGEYAARRPMRGQYDFGNGIYE